MTKQILNPFQVTLVFLVSQLANIGIDILDEKLIDWILTSLSSNWDVFEQHISTKEKSRTQKLDFARKRYFST